MGRLVMGLCLLVAVVLSSGEAPAQEIRVDLPAHGISVTRDARGYAAFSGTKMQYLNLPGEPALPYRAVKVLLPPDADLSTVRVSLSGIRTRQLPGTWDVRPMPAVAIGDRGTPHWPEGKRIVAGRDVSIYTTGALYPASRVMKPVPGRKRTWVLTDVLVAPYQYNPVTRRLVSLESAALRVSFSTREPRRFGPAVKADTLTDDQVSRDAVNFSEAAPSYTLGSEQPALSDGGPGYVIITTSAIENTSSQLAAFALAKERRGYEVSIVTEDIWGGGTGDAAAENIRNWLMANYASLGIRYVLLVGNPSPYSGDVPMKMLWPRRNATWETSYRESPSDQYYADLTGDWDYDGDGYYGEWGDDFAPDGVDLNTEVLVGRIPCYGSISDLDGILAKITAYQDEPLQDLAWRQNVLLAMKPSDEETPGYHLGEAIRNSFLVPGSWGWHRVYESYYGLDPLPESVPCTVDGVTGAWAGGHFGAVFWFTHGNATQAADVMDLSHAALLDDSRPGFTFQASCSNAAPENTNNLAYSLLRNGCVATVGATRVSWYWVGQTGYVGTSSNAGMAYEYAGRLIAGDMSAAGALSSLREDVYLPDDTSWMNYTGFNLYGCPEAGLSSHGMPADLCACDLNADGRCDMEDWLVFGQRWGATDCATVPCACDLNADGRCDMRDWLLFGEDWGRTDCPDQ